MFYVMIIVASIIVAIILLVNKISDLKKENNKLKAMLNNITHFCPNCGFDLYNNQTGELVPQMEEKVALIDNPPEMVQPQPEYVAPIAVMPVEQKRDEKEIKNSFILIVGSILIVLSAIIFLTTTWNVVDNMVKTFVLLLMLIIFYGISYIAEHKLNLKQASNTFYYIALAYIPIVFMSISMFSLFGEYLSLYGQGKYIYLAISSFIVNAIYYFNAKTKNNNIIFIFSLIFQVLGITFLSLAINDTYNTPLLSLVIYNTIILLLYKYNKIYYDKDIHYYLTTIITILSNVILLFTIFAIQNLIFNTIILLINFFNIYTLTNNISNLNKLFKYIYPTYIVLLFFNISLSIESIMVKQILVLLAYILIYIYDLFKDKTINISSFISILVTFPVYSFYCIIMALFEHTLLPAYISFLALTILSFIYWFTTNKYKIFPSIVLILSLTLTSFTFLDEYNFPTIIAGYILLGVLILSMITKDKSLYYPSKYIPLAIIFYGAIETKYADIPITILYCLTALSTLIYVLIKKKDEVYKISSYVLFNIFLFYLCDVLKLNYIEYMIPLTTLLIIVLEECRVDLKTIPSKIYLLLQYLISVLLLGFNDNGVQFITLTILSLLAIYYIYDNKENNYFLSLPVLGMTPVIYGTDLFIINEFNYMYIISLLIISLIGYLMYNKKHNVYTILYFILITLHVSNLEISDYLGISLYIIGCTICYLIKENTKTKDIYQGFLYFFILLLGKQLIYDLELSNVALFNYGIYLFFIIALTRTLFKKYGNFYKVIEYIFTILVNLIAIGNYNSEMDGLLYVVLLVALVIISYVNKYGPTFITSLVFIVLNVFLLTREFWFNIPWWLYILALGGILVGFAINNEARDKQNNTKEKVKELKDYLDM